MQSEHLQEAPRGQPYFLSSVRVGLSEWVVYLVIALRLNFPKLIPVSKVKIVAPKRAADMNAFAKFSGPMSFVSL